MSSHFNVEPDAAVPLKVTLDGPASAQPTTVIEVFKDTVAVSVFGESFCWASLFFAPPVEWHAQVVSAGLAG
jgi:hypothetical protein